MTLPRALASPSTPRRLIIYASTLSANLVHPPIGSKSRDIYPDKMPARRGLLFVPENRDNSSSRDIAIGFWVVKSTAPHPGAPIVYLSGGPGHSWVESEAQTYDYMKTIRRLAAVSDVILFDQRGAGSPSISLPSLQCPNSFGFPLNSPWQTRADQIAAYAEKWRVCATYFMHDGADLRGYNNRSSATDLDELRKALGYPQLNLWGESYGGYLAQTYISMFPRSVAHAVIGETEVAKQNPRVAMNKARPMFDRIANGFTSESGLKFPADPALVGDTERALDRLTEHPLTVRVNSPVDGTPISITLGRYDLQFAIAWSLQIPTDRYGEISDGIRGILRGDGRWLGDYTVRWRLGIHRSLVAGKLMGFLMECNLTLPRRASNAVDGADDPVLGTEQLDGPFPQVCDALEPLLHHDPAPVPRAVPTLFWAGDLDSTTPLADTLALQRKTPGSSLAILRNAGHTGGAASQQEQLLALIIRFFQGEAVAPVVTLE